MKVLHICPGYFGSKLYENLFFSLQAIKVDNEIITLSEKKIEHFEKIPSNIVVLEKEFNPIERFIYFKKQNIIYSKICKEYSLNDLNLVHAHTLFSAGYSAYLLHKKFGLPYIVAIRNTDVYVFFRFMMHLRGLGHRILNNAQNIIFLSPAYRDYLAYKYYSKKRRQIILNKSIVIPNGIDEYFFDNKCLTKRITNKEFIKLIYVGYITGNKNIETTIKACKMLLKSGHFVKYTIVGEILDEKYKKIIAKHNFIDYHPKCSKDEILLYLRNSDIFIMPSIHETFGLAYAEAMSQGIPIIYSKGQGFDGQFENGVVGFAVDCFDYKEIVQKIIHLYNDYEQFSRRCVSFVDKFKWPKIAEEYRRIYTHRS